MSSSELISNVDKIGLGIVLGILLVISFMSISSIYSIQKQLDTIQETIDKEPELLYIAIPRDHPIRQEIKEIVLIERN